MGNVFEDLRSSILNSMKDAQGISNDSSWEPFGNVDQQFSDNKDKLQRHQDFVNKKFNDVFGTEDGQWIIKYWRSQYLDQPTYSSQCDGEQSRNYAIWRDGQNSVLREVISRVISARK